MEAKSYVKMLDNIIERKSMKKNKNKILSVLRKCTAGALATAMVITTAPYFGGMEAKASTLVDNAELDPGAPTGANDGITRVNESAGGIHKAGDYTTYGQSQGTVYRYGQGGVSSNYQDNWGGAWFVYPNATNPVASNHSIANDTLNLHGRRIYDSGNSHQYTFDIGAILDPGAVEADPRKTFGAAGAYKASKSAYGQNWWSTYIGFGQTGEHKTVNPTDMMPVISPRDIKYAADGFTYPKPGRSNNQSDTATPPDHKVIGIFNDNFGTTVSKGNGRVVEVEIPQYYKDYVNATYGAGTTANPANSNKIEVRMELKPTADKQKLLIVWTGYNPNTYPVEFWIGAQSDSQVAGTDVAPTIVTADHKRLHMMDYYNQNVNNGVAIPQADGSTRTAGGTTLWTMPRFADIPNGFKKPDSLTDLDIELIAGEGRVWAGDNQKPNNLGHDNFVFGQNADYNLLVQMYDAATAFSGRLNMAAGQSASTTFRVSMRAAVYYVDPTYTGNDSNGYIAQPFKDIQSAITAMKAIGAKKGYVYVMSSDANPVLVNSTITVPAGLDVQIETSPYKTTAIAGKTTYGVYEIGDPINNDTSVIRRDPSFTGDMFKMDQSTSHLSFYNINIDGNKANVTAKAPMLHVTAGRVTISDKTSLYGAKVAGTIDTNGDGTKDKYEADASAIFVEAAGELSLAAEADSISISDNETEVDTAELNLRAPSAVAIGNSSVATRPDINNQNIAMPLKLYGNVDIQNNKIKTTTVVGGVPTTNEADGNVALGVSELLVPSGKKFTGTVGVSVKELPKGDTSGRAIVDYEDRAAGSTILPYSAGNFKADATGTGNAVGIPTYMAVDNATGDDLTSAPDHENSLGIYLHTLRYNYTVTYVDEDGMPLSANHGSVSAATNKITLDNTLTQIGGSAVYQHNPAASPAETGGNSGENVTAHYSWRGVAGSPVEINAPTYPGYAVAEVTGIPTGVTGDNFTNTNGKIEGKTPEQNVDIVIKYRKNEVTYHFDAAGGAPNPGDKTETTYVSGVHTSTLGSLPIPTKTGYTFGGWYVFTDNDGNGKYDKPTTDPVTGAVSANDGDPFTGATALTGYYDAMNTLDPVYNLVAKWVGDGTPWNIDTRHKNDNAALELNFGTEHDTRLIEEFIYKDPLTEIGVTIPGYKKKTVSNTPANVGTRAPLTDAHPLRYTIDSMPAKNVNVVYKYMVDSTVTFNYTVEHVDGGGNALRAAHTIVKRAEQPINAQAENISGYTFDHYEIDHSTGWDSHIATGDNPRLVGLDGAAGNLIVSDNPLSTSPNPGVFAAYMPNQDVKIKYVYTSDSSSNLVRRYLDAYRDKLLDSGITQVTPGTAYNLSINYTDKLYGYTWDPTVSRVDFTPTGYGESFNPANGDITGNMPLALSGVNGIRADYRLGLDLSKWRDVEFRVTTDPNFNHGSINPLAAGAPTKVLVSDGSTAGDAAAYNFNRLQAENYVPTTSANRYYMFEGWYMDAAATIPVTGTTFWNTDTTPIIIYAKFVEDPSKWFDINFAAGSNGSISAPSTLHTPFDYTWGQITPQLPTATPVINYNFNGWDDAAGNHMLASSTLTNHATYTAIFGKDPNTWGTNVGAFTPIGRIGGDGSGEIEIRGSKPGNVYVISKPDGEIVAVVTGDPTGNTTTVPDLIPGAHYNVQEGTPDTIANVGGNVSGITGTSVSTPQDVFIPTVDNNYNVGYDPDNDGMARIVINPADPDADYALIDEAGNVVSYPGSDNGWMTPAGNNPATVTFNNLNPNETYTVVARKHGDSTLADPLIKLPDGSQINANPGDMAEVAKYVVETRNGVIVSVKDNMINSDVFEEAHAGETVTIHADPTDANGKAFKYWNVLAGRAVGVSGNITDADYSFRLSNSNIVLKAVYEPTKIIGDDADLHEELRGKASQGEFGLEPNQIPTLANHLTTPGDRDLQSVNGADVDYRVIFDKRDTTNVESSLVKPVSISGTDHPGAYTAAYSLDIKLERYVDGRRVDAGITATASNATVDVIAQLPAADIDQLDYQLFDITTGTPVEITLTTDVANNAGLMKFTGNLSHTYVTVYSKTFRVTFIDNIPVLDHRYLNDTSRNFYKQFKVRRRENVEDAWYSSDYTVVTDYARNDVPNALETPFDDIYGVTYTYENWSKNDNTLKIYDTTKEVTKRTAVYAYYSNNKPMVDKARIDLGKTIEEAYDLMYDPYLKAGEAANVQEAIDTAKEVLRRARGLIAPDGSTYLRMSNYPELQAAIDALREILDRYRDKSKGRMDERIRRTGGASGGGNSSNGRGSKLLAPGEKSKQNTAINENSNVRAFVLGVDGNWERNSVTGGWSFVLNGGTPINDMWGMITFNDSTGKKVSRWYYFDGRSTMATGWTYDSKNGRWYYMNTTEGPELGQMVTGWVKDPKTNKWYYMNDNTGILETGWHLDKQDGRWYYLDLSGEMLLGWQNISGKYYYFNTVVPQKSYEWDANAFKWNYLNNNVRPYGSMYAGEATPDGYSVDANGAWIQ